MITDPFAEYSLNTMIGREERKNWPVYELKGWHSVIGIGTDFAGTSVLIGTH